MARKTEAQKANEVFEIYYQLPTNKRSLQNLAKVTQLDFNILNEWSEAYGWDELIESREKDLQRTYDKIYKQKTIDIRNRLTRQIEKLLASMENSSLGLPFEMKSPNDLRALAQAYEALVRANIAAQTKGIDVSGGKTPKTWSDLLNQADVDSLPEIED